MKQFLKQLPLSLKLMTFEAIWLFLLELKNVKCNLTLEIKSIIHITQTQIKFAFELLIQV